ncbi:hypothetical protein HMPREF9374_0813 [Desmospora sp. 8437]|nr:hypothetical protein HMPREF9374_0813 [Desmospora sp. 8437]
MVVRVPVQRSITSRPPIKVQATSGEACRTLFTLGAMGALSGILFFGLFHLERQYLKKFSYFLFCQKIFFQIRIIFHSRS